MKNRLQQEKHQLQLRIDELSSQDPFSDPDRLNDNAASDTEASEESGHERIKAQMDELKRQNEAIDAALERIAQGTYGVCTNCGKNISEERLSVMPTATRCMDCQSN